MNILINGTSLTQGQGQWADFLQKKLGRNYNIVNIAQAGAGNTYIHEATVSELSERPYDLLILQWTYFDRLDIRVKDITQFQDTTYTTEYQTTYNNDWKGKIIYPVNDQDYVQKDWIFGCGYLNEQKDDSIGKVFKEYYNVTGPYEHMFSSLMKMISLQNTLIAMNIPYVFMTYRPFLKLERFEHLYKLIDWSKFYDTTHLYTLAKEYDALDETDHPLPTVQKMHANNLYDALKERKLIDHG